MRLRGGLALDVCVCVPILRSMPFLSFEIVGIWGLEYTQRCRRPTKLLLLQVASWHPHLFRAAKAAEVQRARDGSTCGIEESFLAESL